jgi:hypothetical protein
MIAYSFCLFDEIDQFACGIASPDCLQLDDVPQVLVEYLISKLFGFIRFHILPFFHSSFHH